jgi:hypothetical protein
MSEIQAMARGYWIQMHCDLERLGIVEDLSRLCPQSVTEMSQSIPGSVPNRSPRSTSDDYVPVIPRDRCTMIGALHVVWSRFYEQGERVEGTGDIRLREHPGKLDEITGVAGFARALASVGWLCIEGPKSIVAPRLRKKFGEVVEANAVDRVEARARRKAKGNANAGNDNHEPSPIAGVPDLSPKCPRNVTSTEQNKTEHSKSPHSPPKGDDDAKKHPRTIPAYTEAFNAFWNRYPPSNRVNKKGAFRVWCKQHIEREAEPGKPRMLDFVMAGLDKWCQCERWKAGFVCMPTTFLNQARWSNDPPHDERQP